MKFKGLLAALFLCALPVSVQDASDSRAQEIQELRHELAHITARLDELERTASAPTATTTKSAAVTPSQPEAVVLRPEDAQTLGFFRDTTINFGMDGYHGYNFNQPIGRVNLLCVYDVTSNSFNINRASVVVEHLPTAKTRFGGRLDLQYRQATETLEGSGNNEQRPQVWRNVFQAYGSYVAQLGSGLEIDYGKFASALGGEGNYTKDQIAYSRSYSFNFLPYYHMGVHTDYNVTPKVNIAYWFANGAQQTEDFNGFKSQAFLFTLKPTSSLTWNMNYYFGQEQRDVLPTLNSGHPTSSAQLDLPTMNVSPAPDGREHIFESYAAWNATPKLTLVGESDYMHNRTKSHSRPACVVIGALYAKYAMPKNWNIGGRFEYFDDRVGLLSGST